jgi:hypothetical protein
VVVPDKEGPFEDLKRALGEIEAEGIVEEETEEDRQWTEALRAATVGEAGFGSLMMEEMEAIADSTPGYSLDTDRLKRTREFLRQQKVGGGGKAGVAEPAVPAAIFRREGPSNSMDQQKAQETLERLRRKLDEEEDDPQP